MKTPIDAVSAGATAALLNGGADFVMLDLWAITLSGGAVIRWHAGTGDKRANAAGSYTFTAASGQPTFANGTYVKGPPIDRGKVSTKLGVEVATLDATFIANANDLINGVPLLSFVRGNGFDGATVVLYRAFLSDWGQPITGVTIEFSGRVTTVKNLSRTKFDLTVSAWTVLLNVNMGPDVYQAGCLNTHYDADCTLTQTFVSGTVTGGGTTGGCNSNLTQADGFFTKGQLIWQTGANAGLRRAVAAYLNSGGAISFAFPLPYPPAPGDTFTASRGCLLTTADCSAQSNLIHFRGQPFTPPAVTAVVNASA